MLLTNVTQIDHFYITGFPGLSAEYYGPVSALLFIVFLAIAVGNIFILVLVKCERSLHKPTYLIFCHLALSDLAFGTVTLPKMISKFWFSDSLIEFYSCFVQMFFVHFLGAAHSVILMVMALDRFIAVYSPLRYPSTFTNNIASLLCGIGWFLSMSFLLFVVIHALSLPYCNSNVIVQCYCDHISLTSLGCENVRAHQVIAFGGAMFFLLVPLCYIISSYLAIIVVVMKMSSNEGQMKTLSTCTPQLLITLLYFTPICFVYLANNVGFTFSDPVRVLVVILYSLVPAAVNPIIYCFKTKDIKECLKKKYNMKTIHIKCLFKTLL